MAPKKIPTPTSASSNQQQQQPQGQQNSQKSTTNNEQVKNSGSQRIGGDGPRISRSKRAGVIFPVLKILRTLKEEKSAYQVRNTAAIYLAGVLEYLVAEVAELAGNAAHDQKRKRITPRHIFLAISHDEELHKLCEKVTIAAGGALPHIHEVLLQLKSNSSFSLKGNEMNDQNNRSQNKNKKQKTTSNDE